MTRNRMLTAAAVSMLVACGGREDIRGEPLQNATRSALVSENALTTNALTTNALTTNALTTNALTTNALTTNALTSNALTTNAITTNALTSNGISTSPTARMDGTPILAGRALESPEQGKYVAELIKYSVRCMLEAEQSVRVHYREPSGEPVRAEYVGNLGLQPHWIDAPLDDSDRLWWAACIGAHVNDNGPVEISARSDTHTALGVTDDERVAFPRQEGAIWATYDASAQPPMHFYTCRGKGYDASATTRHCLAESGQCGPAFTYVGTCESACETSESGNLDRCRHPGARDASRQVITVYVR